MFEEMRDSRFACGLVGGADLVPAHVRHHRRPVIRNDDEFETVGEFKIGDARPLRLRERAARAERKQKRGGETGNRSCGPIVTKRHHYCFWTGRASRLTNPLPRGLRCKDTAYQSL